MRAGRGKGTRSDPKTSMHVFQRQLCDFPFLIDACVPHAVDFLARAIFKAASSSQADLTRCRTALLTI